MYVYTVCAYMYMYICMYVYIMMNIEDIAMNTIYLHILWHCVFLFYFIRNTLYIRISVHIPRHFSDTLVMKTCISIILISFVHKIILIPIEKKKRKL